MLLSLRVRRAMGLLLHFLVFRPLRTAPPLAKVVASVGVLLLLQAIVTAALHLAGAGHRPSRASEAGDLPGDLHEHDEQLLASSWSSSPAVLWALFRFTRFGLATRAAAENEKGAMLLGFSPDLLAGTNWVLSTVMPALLGILGRATRSRSTR